MCKPGFRPLLEELKAAEVPTAVVSNASTSRARATLERAGLTDYFADVVCSDQDGTRAKPDPSMYQYLQNKYAVSPEHMVVVESSSIGVAAARAAAVMLRSLSTTSRFLDQSANRSPVLAMHAISASGFPTVCRHAERDCPEPSSVSTMAHFHSPLVATDRDWLSGPSQFRRWQIPLRSGS